MSLLRAGRCRQWSLPSLSATFRRRKLTARDASLALSVSEYARLVRGVFAGAWRSDIFDRRDHLIGGTQALGQHTHDLRGKKRRLLNQIGEAFFVNRDKFAITGGDNSC